jgi:hypothetical protein
MSRSKTIAIRRGWRAKLRGSGKTPNLHPSVKSNLVHPPENKKTNPNTIVNSSASVVASVFFFLLLFGFFSLL